MITLALIGLGRWGKNYLKTIEKIKNIKVNYICTNDKKSLNKYRSSYVIVNSYKELSQYKDIDGIIIATPSYTHFEIAKYFLSLDYNLLIEKPVTINLREAIILNNLQKKIKAVIMIGHIFLYNPAYLTFKETIKDIGKIRYMDFEGHNFGPFPDRTSALIEWGPHDISMCLDLIDETPLAISAYQVNQLKKEKDANDMIFARLKFRNNIDVFMKFGWLSPIKRRTIVVVGSKSSVVFDDVSKKKVIFFQNLKPKIYYPSYSQEEPLRAEVLEFVDCILKKRKPKTDLEAGVRIMRVIHYLQKSINKNGEIIHIPEDFSYES